MNVMEVMAAARPNFTPNDELIYLCVSSDPEGVSSLTTSQLAMRCGVSQPALTRFVKTLGYARYQDFRTDLVAWTSSQRSEALLGDGHLSHFLTIYRALAQLELLLTDEYMHELAQYVSRFERVFAVGISKSHHPALLLEQLMIKTNRPFHAMEIGLLNEVSDALTEQDLIIVFSLSQRDATYNVLSSTTGKILLATATPNGPISKIADRQIVFPSATSNPEESSISPVMFDMFVELLVKYLLVE